MKLRQFATLAAIAAAIAFVPMAPSALGQNPQTSATPAETSDEAPDRVSGTVVYQETVKFEIDLPPQMERMRSQIPDSRTSSVVLLFDETRSLSQLAPEQEAQEQTVRGRGIRFSAMGGRPDNATFVDFENETSVQRREFLDRVFLIDGADRPSWKLTTDQSEFLGYVCHRAIATVDSMLVEAWFTPEIPVPAGPDQYYGLPGLILVVTTDEGKRSWVATDVSIRPIDPSAIAAPTSGRKVTKEEYDKIVDEKRAEMEAMRGGRRGGITILRN